MKIQIFASILLSANFVFAGFAELPAQDSSLQPTTRFQPSENTTQTSEVPESQHPALVKRVGFRMTNWQTIHSDGTPATQERITTLQNIGCEVRQDNHGGHVDIGFRCPTWKTISVQDDDQSDQWRNWLVENEFETVVLNPPTNTVLPTVKVRLTAWKTFHAGSAEQAQSFKETYQLIGCEVETNDHGGHIDTRVRCQNWATIGLVNGHAAHVWQDWLNKSGFETQHDHTADGYDAHAGHDHAAENDPAHDHSGHDHAAGHGHNH